MINISTLKSLSNLRKFESKVIKLRVCCYWMCYDNTTGLGCLHWADQVIHNGIPLTYQSAQKNVLGLSAVKAFNTHQVKVNLEKLWLRGSSRFNSNASFVDGPCVHRNRSKPRTSMHGNIYAIMYWLAFIAYRADHQLTARAIH